MKLKDFMNNLKKEDRVAIVYHPDSDGLCAGVISAHAVKLARGKPIDAHRNSFQRMSSKTVKWLRKFNKVIFVDLGIEKNKDQVKDITKHADLVCIDHHKIFPIPKIKNAYFYRKAEPYCPASRMTWDLFSKMYNLEKYKWISAVGIIGDMGEKHNQDLLKELPYSFEELFKISEQIEFSYISKPCKIERAFDLFLSINKPSELKNTWISKLGKEIKKEIQHWRNIHKEKAEFYPKKELVLLEIKSKYRIKSSLINYLSINNYPKQTVIVYHLKNSQYLVSARRQDGKVAVNDLLEKACKGLEGCEGGGHAPAAGAKVTKKYFPVFKKRILELV